MKALSTLRLESRRGVKRPVMRKLADHLIGPVAWYSLSCRCGLEAGLRVIGG